MLKKLWHLRDASGVAASDGTSDFREEHSRVRISNALLALQMSDVGSSQKLSIIYNQNQKQTLRVPFWL